MFSIFHSCLCLFFLLIGILTTQSLAKAENPPPNKNTHPGPVYNFYFQNYPQNPVIIPTPAVETNSVDHNNQVNHNNAENLPALESTEDTKQLTKQNNSLLTTPNQSLVDEIHYIQFHTLLTLGANTTMGNTSLFKSQGLSVGLGFEMGRFLLSGNFLYQDTNAAFHPPEEFVNHNDEQSKIDGYKERYKGNLPGAGLSLSYKLIRITDNLSFNIGILGQLLKGKLKHDFVKGDEIKFMNGLVQGRATLSWKVSKNFQTSLAYGLGETRSWFYQTPLNRPTYSRYYYPGGDYHIITTYDRGPTDFKKTVRLTQGNLKLAFSYVF